MKKFRPKPRATLVKEDRYQSMQIEGGKKKSKRPTPPQNVVWLDSKTKILMLGHNDLRYVCMEGQRVKIYHGKHHPDCEAWGWRHHVVGRFCRKRGLAGFQQTDEIMAKEADFLRNTEEILECQRKRSNSGVLRDSGPKNTSRRATKGLKANKDGAYSMSEHFQLDVGSELHQFCQE